MKVAIAGGGIIGASIAYHLQKAGASVVLIERGEIGCEASSAAAGMLIAPIEDTGNEAFNNLRHASLDSYPALIDEVRAASGIDFEYKTSGMIRTASSEHTARKLREIARTQPGFEWLEPDALHKLEPALATDLLGAAYCPADADLNPGLWTKAIAAAAQSLGAEVMRASVTGFACTGSRIDEVCTDYGDVHADAVVLAAGPWTELLSMHLGPMLPTPPMRGQMLAYTSDALRHAIWGEDGYLVPKLRSEVWAGATVEDAGFDKTNTPEAIAGIREMAAVLVPNLADAEVARTWSGLRPGSADGLPIIGPVPGKDNAYVATGHFRNGILLAPITGRLVADLVLEGRLDDRLLPFAPARFA